MRENMDQIINCRHDNNRQLGKELVPAVWAFPLPLAATAAAVLLRRIYNTNTVWRSFLPHTYYLSLSAIFCPYVSGK